MSNRITKGRSRYTSKGNKREGENSLKAPIGQGLYVDFFREKFSVETWLKIKSTQKNIHYHGPKRSTY